MKKPAFAGKKHRARKWEVEVHFCRNKCSWYYTVLVTIIQPVTNANITSATADEYDRCQHHQDQRECCQHTPPLGHPQRVWLTPTPPGPVRMPPAHAPPPVLCERVPSCRVRDPDFKYHWHLSSSEKPTTECHHSIYKWLCYVASSTNGSMPTPAQTSTNATNATTAPQAQMPPTAPAPTDEHTNTSAKHRSVKRRTCRWVQRTCQQPRADIIKCWPTPTWNMPGTYLHLAFMLIFLSQRPTLSAHFEWMMLAFFYLL